MKILKLIFYVSLLFFISCEKDDSTDPKGSDPDPEKPDTPIVVDMLDLSAVTIQFTAEKDAKLIIVKTHKSWSASSDADWLTLSTVDGDTATAFLIGASENKMLEREATVTISGSDKTKDINIVQAGVSKIEFEIRGVSFTFLPVKADTTFYLDGATYIDSRTIYLDSYFISETEITNAQWKAITGSLPYDDEYSFPNYPVNVNWNNISENFIPKINELTDGYEIRLPTEHEWEVAARGARIDENTLYPGSMYVDSVAWYFQNSDGRKHNVALKKRNELGLYDMSGNVSEWCSDWYEAWTDSNPPPDGSTNPTGPDTGTEKVLRGGDILADRLQYDPNSCAIYSRNHLPPDVRFEDYQFFPPYTGFRLVISKQK